MLKFVNRNTCKVINNLRSLRDISKDVDIKNNKIKMKLNLNNIKKVMYI